jgi:hypothetical protein
MSNDSPFLQYPPVHDNLLTHDNKITDIWKNHIDSITQATGYVVAHDRFTDTKQEVAVSQVRSMTLDRRNHLQTAANGTILYITDTNLFNVRQGGAWWSFTLVPA